MTIKKKTKQLDVAHGNSPKYANSTIKHFLARRRGISALRSSRRFLSSCLSVAESLYPPLLTCITLQVGRDCFVQATNGAIHLSRVLLQTV
jgi:hypothetical protein